MFSLDSLEVTNEEIKIDTSVSHVSLVIHEQLLNDFFNNIGKIKGNSSGSSIDYEWSLMKPRIEIHPEEALFFAKINAKTDVFSITRDVEGSVKVIYNEEENIIEVSIDKADVILDVNLFGKNVLLGEIDIAKYFTKSFVFEGLKSYNNEIDFTLPNANEKKINVQTKTYELVLLEDMIQLTVEFNFKEID